MRRADLQEVLYGAFTSETPSYYYAKEMRYPQRGGFRAFIEPMLSKLCIRCEHRATNIYLEKKQVRFANGEFASFNHLINTMPLPELIKIIDVVPEEIRDAAQTLFATSVDLISVGFRKATSSRTYGFTFMTRILASRAYSPDIKSQDNVPAGCSSLQFEIYSPKTPAADS